jgi:hypothetical protein
MTNLFRPRPVTALVVAAGGHVVADFDGGHLPSHQFAAFAALLAASTQTPSVCIVRSPYCSGWFIAEASAYSVSGLEFLPYVNTPTAITKKAPPVAHPTGFAAGVSGDGARQGDSAHGDRRQANMQPPVVITGRAIKVVPQ